MTAFDNRLHRNPPRRSGRGVAEPLHGMDQRNTAPRGLHRAAIGRIALFVFDFSATGVVRNCIAIANRLHADGHDVRLIACCAEGTLRPLVDAGIAVQIIEQNIGKRAGAASRRLRLIRCFAGLRSLLGAMKPDILLSTGNHAHALCLAASVGMKGIRRIYRISNDLDHGRRDVASWARRVIMGAVVRDAAHLILVSPHLLADETIRGAAQRGRVSVIPNGVQVDCIRARAAQPVAHRWLGEGRDASIPTVIGIGRIVEQKNFDTLVRALAIAGRVRPMRLLILGDGSEQARRDLIALAEAEGVADRIDLVGAVDNPFAYLARADAFALPSRWEGAPNVLLEAIACGLPVIASRTAGNAADVLGGGRFGMLIDPEDTDALAAALLRQTGPDRLMPGDRARDFDIADTMNGYAALVAGMMAEAVVEGPAPWRPVVIEGGASNVVPARGVAAISATR